MHLPPLDHTGWTDHRAALTHLDEAGFRLDEARARNAEDLGDVEQAFQDAMRAYDALRKRLFEAVPSGRAGAPVARVWLGPAAVVLRAPAVR